MYLHIANYGQSESICSALDEDGAVRIKEHEERELSLTENGRSSCRDAVQDASLGLSIGSGAISSPAHESGDCASPASAARCRLEARANQIQMLIHPHRTRLRPPTSRNRIYSDAELAVATEMFHKLKQGEDRRPYPRQRANIPISGPIDPLDRVAEVLLDLFDL